MIPTQNLTDFNEFANSGDKTPPETAKYAEGYLAGETFPAVHANYLFNKASVAATEKKAGLTSVEQELNTILTDAGIEPNVETQGQVLAAIKIVAQLLNVASATKLQTARAIQVNLASTSAANFNGTADITPGVNGTLAVANGGTGATDLANITVGKASNLSAGSANSLPYQSSAGTTAYLAAGTSGQVLQTKGSSAAPEWVNQSSLSVGAATTATNIAGGAKGSLPYQSGAGATSLLAAGTSGQVLKTNGTSGAPEWVNQSSLSVGYAASAGSAGSATSAGSCTGNAATATSAIKATQDGNGANIASTYLKKSAFTWTSSTGTLALSL